jgi:hypothetical protein
MMKPNEQLIEDRLGLFLVLAGSILLAVWAIQHTIALRNILLGSGAMLSLTYLYLIRDFQVTKIKFTSMLPLLFICIFFFWVITHFLLFSSDESTQLKELSSTWSRALLGAILGSAIGIIISRRPKQIYLLACGLLVAFIVLFYQYLHKVSVNQQIFQIDFLNYIFAGKINGVLMGTLLIAGAGGALVDHLRSTGGNSVSIKLSSICLLSIVVPLYSYVFIFDTRNGIALAFILLFFWVVWSFFFFLKDGVSSFILVTQRKLIILVIPLIAVGVFSIFAALQLKHNPAWIHVIEDIKESYQTEKYPQWRDVNHLGDYPVLSSGRTITPNVFERVSWAMGGLEALSHNPWGNGILQDPLQRTLRNIYPEVKESYLPRSTHSAWIDMALSFGIFGVLCLLSSLVVITCQALRAKRKNKGVVLSLSVATFFTSFVGELCNMHAVEILLFILSLLSGLSLVPVHQRHQHSTCLEE